MYINTGGGVKPEGTINITNNGTHDVTEYAEANVQVPASAVCSGTISITSNGTKTVTGYKNASVNVPAHGSGSVYTSETTGINVKINGTSVLNTALRAGTTTSFTF